MGAGVVPAMMRVRRTEGGAVSTVVYTEGRKLFLCPICESLFSVGDDWREAERAANECEARCSAKEEVPCSG